MAAILVGLIFSAEFSYRHRLRSDCTWF